MLRKGAAPSEGKETAFAIGFPRPVPSHQSPSAPPACLGMQFEERAALLTWELWGQGPVLMEVWLPGPNWEGNRGPQEWSGWGFLGLVSLLMELQPGRGWDGDLLVP